MARGGRDDPRDGPERRCVASGESAPVEGLVRFALAPDGMVTPDLAERLPGRGVWVVARRDMVEKAARRNFFARGFRAAARVPEGLADLVEAGLARRAVEAIGLARKAGLATTGAEKVKARLRTGPVAALIEAADGSEQGKARLRPLAGEAPRVDRLTAAELGLAFGREFVIHAVLDAGGAAERVVRESRRLAGFRSGSGTSADFGRAGGSQDGDPVKDDS